RLYRADRCDVEASIPADASIDTAIGYGKNHTIRVLKADGIYLNQNGAWVNTSPTPYLRVRNALRYGTAEAKDVVQRRIQASGLGREPPARRLALGALPLALALVPLRRTRARLRGERARPSRLDDIVKQRFGEIRRAVTHWRKFTRLHTNACGDFTL